MNNINYLISTYEKHKPFILPPDQSFFENTITQLQLLILNNDFNIPDNIRHTSNWSTFNISRYPLHNSIHGTISEILTLAHINKTSTIPNSFATLATSKQYQLNNIDIIMQYPTYSTSIQTKSGTINLTNNTISIHPDWFLYNPPSIHKFHRLAIIDHSPLNIHKIFIADYNISKLATYQYNNKHFINIHTIKQKTTHYILSNIS